MKEADRDGLCKLLKVTFRILDTILGVMRSHTRVLEE